MRRALLLFTILLLLPFTYAAKTSDVTFSNATGYGVNSIDTDQFCGLNAGAQILTGGTYGDYLNLSVVARQACVFNNTIGGAMTLDNMFAAGAGTYGLLFAKNKALTQVATQRLFADTGGYFYAYAQNTTAISATFYDGSARYNYPVVANDLDYQTIIVAWDGTKYYGYSNGVLTYTTAGAGIQAAGLSELFGFGGTGASASANTLQIARWITYDETLDASAAADLHTELTTLTTPNTTWIEAVDELPVNATTFLNGSTIGLQGYCSTNGTLIEGIAWLNYYPNNTFAQTITNASDLTNATSSNWSFTSPAQSLNYSWFLQCNATTNGVSESTAANSSGRYFLTNLPAPAPSPSPSPSPTATAAPGVSDGGTYAGGYQLTYNVRRVCLPFKVCVPFTELCLTLWSVCENEGIDFIAN